MKLDREMVHYPVDATVAEYREVFRRRHGIPARDPTRKDAEARARALIRTMLPEKPGIRRIHQACLAHGIDVSRKVVEKVVAEIRGKRGRMP